MTIIQNHRPKSNLNNIQLIFRTIYNVLYTVYSIVIFVWAFNGSCDL